MNTKIKKAYLYSRVSSVMQVADGHGLDRQVDAAKKFLEGYPEYIVDETEIIRDAGISAYSGANIADSAGLGGFMSAVREGRVERGSLLVLEAPDRLTRLGIRKGQRLFDELADHGIDIGLVRFGVIIRHDADNDFTSSLIVSIGLYLGHLESKQKSERICASMQKMRNNIRDGHVYANNRSPRWLSVTEDGKFELNVSAEGIKEMFNMRLKGYGATRISKSLNERGFEKEDGSKWVDWNVTHYLRCRTVLGEYQPTKGVKENGKKVFVSEGAPVSNYYPQIVDQKTFYMVQELLDNVKGGSVGQFTNYLRDIVECSVCGGSTYFRFSSQSVTRYGYNRCIVKEKKGVKVCSSKDLSMIKIDKYVLPVLRQFDYSTLYTTSPVTLSESVENKLEIERLQLSLVEDKKVVSSLSGASRLAVDSVIHDTEKKLSELMSKTTGAPSYITKQMVEAADLAIKENTLDTPEKRQQFNVNLKQFIKTIKFEKDTWSIFFRGVDFEIKLPYDMKENTDILSAMFKHRAELNKPQDDIEKVRQVLAQ